MAEHLELPEKPFITVQEAAKRWETNIAHVLLLFRDGLIIPMYPFYDLVVDVWVDFVPEVEPDGNLSFEGNRVRNNVLFENFQLYVWSYTRQKKVTDDKSQVCINLKDAWLTKKPRGQISEWYSPHPEKYDQLIPVESLVITRQELDHVEKFYFKTKLKPLKANERENLYMTIGVLARLVAKDKPNKYGSLDNVKAHPMAMELEKHMAKHKISTKGLSSKTLAKRIAKGLKLLK